MDERTLNIVAAALQWEARYRKGEYLAGTGAFLPPIDGLDPDFVQALSLFGLKGGRLLDIGSGTGDQARHFSKLGFQVTATDASPTAVAHARKAPDEAGDEIEFLVDDILRTTLRGPYDLIVDRGCYTLLAEEWMRGEYCRTVHGLLAPQGLFFLKTDAKNSVIEELTGRFVILHSRESRYHDEKGPKAAFFVLKSASA